MAIPQAKAQLGVLNDLLGSVSIEGTVFCTSKDNNMGVIGDATPVFSSKAKIHFPFIICKSVFFSENHV